MSIVKRKIKSTSVNEQTGEVHETMPTQTEHVYRRPTNGYKGAYMKRVRDIIDRSKAAQRLFFALLDNVNDYNRVNIQWNKITDDTESVISKAKKELQEHNFIAKIGKAWVLNPFIVLPRYQTKSPEIQTEVQQIYRRYVENMNDYYEGIDNDAHELYDIPKPISSN